jgi:hypothetical protein
MPSRSQPHGRGDLPTGSALVCLPKRVGLYLSSQNAVLFVSVDPKLPDGGPETDDAAVYPNLNIWADKKRGKRKKEK